MERTALWSRVMVLAMAPAPADVREAADDRIASFELAFETHYRDVIRFVFLSVQGRDDAEEITAETFARAFAAWRDGRGPAGRPLPWLLVIARRIAADRSRRRRLISWLPMVAADADREAVRGDRNRRAEPGAPDNDAAAREFWMWLDALCRALPPRQREVIFLRYQRDLTDAEIGEVLQISASGVRTLVSRALAALRRHPELWA